MAESQKKLAKTITRCPQCKTAFRVSDEQLKAAKGSVRCGSCLTVFKAHDYLTTSPHKVPARDNDLISDGLDLDETFYNQTGKNSNSLFERQPQKEQRHTEAADESWAVDLLAELEDDDDIRPIVIKRKKDKDKETQNRNKSLTEQATPIKQEPIPKPQLKPPPPPRQKPSKVSEKPVMDEVAQALIEKPRYERKDAYINTIEAPPVEMEWQTHSGIKWWWFLATLIAMLAIVVQVAIFRFDTLSMEQPYRQWYEKICPLVGCELPPQVNIKVIKVTRFNVRKQNGIKMIDFILTNEASFEQPYPDVVITFKDANNRVVAERQFQPKEYLGGPLNENSLMPVKRPVEIGFDIVDLGPKAIGETLSLKESTPR